MLERLTGSEWEQLMQTYVFNPLGIDNTGFGAPGVSGSPNRALGAAAQFLKVRIDAAMAAN